MKKTVVFLISLVASYQLMAKESIVIPGQQSVDLTYEQFANFDVKLINANRAKINVAVFNPGEQEKLKGFGLAPRGKVTLLIDENQILRLTNLSNIEAKVNIKFVEKKQQAKNNGEYITFTLHNSSLKSIPLIIPGVMKPNLSPMSNSGVSLAAGQQIYYRKEGRKILILEVDDSIEEGDKVDVAQLIKNIQ